MSEGRGARDHFVPQYRYEDPKQDENVEFEEANCELGMMASG